MEDTTVDSDSRARITVSPELAAKIAELTELLAQLYPEDEPTAHYALGYAVRSGLISARDELEWREESGSQTTV